MWQKLIKKKTNICFSPVKHCFHQNESETKRFKDSVNSTSSFLTEASEIHNNIIIGEHGEAVETLNATKSHERTNQITDLKHENSSEERYVLDNRNINGSDNINFYDFDIALDSLEENSFDNEDILYNVHLDKSENIEKEEVLIPDIKENIVQSVWV